MGPFAGFAENREPMTRVMRMHRSELDGINRRMAPAALLDAAQELGRGHRPGRHLRRPQLAGQGPRSHRLPGRRLSRPNRARPGPASDPRRPRGAQWQDLGIDVATDEGARTATKFYVNGLEPVVTVETARGYRIQGTPPHRIKVVDRSTGAWEWKRFADIADGDLVPLALNQLVGEPQAVPLPPLAEAYWTGEHHLRPTADDPGAGRAGRLLHG